MELKLYNTLTRTKEPFRPIDPARVGMYVCGPTVYDFAHIGNARPVIVFDVLFRLLRHLAKQGVWDGGKGKTEVRYVRNITDVDDKINARAAEEYPDLPLNEAIRAVTERTAKQFHDDVGALGCLPPTFEPRATEFVLPRSDGKTDMVSLIQRLIDNGHAYSAGGEVLFDTKSMSDYGELSKRNLDDQLEGVRIEVDDHKKNPADFVLWKQSSDNEPGWESPWGRGRPGWHIECSAMSAAYLGETFDIHGGGLDLIFPHHENEIAQSRCAFHTGVMANVWMHNGFLQVEGEKMSKSLGNFFTIRQLRTSRVFGGRMWSGPTLKFAMLQTHYRQPIDWTVRLLEQAEKRLDRWRNFAAERTLRRSNEDALAKFRAALCDDLNTPAALAVIDELINEEKGTNEDRYTVYLALRQLGVRTKKTRIARTAEDFGKLYFRATKKPRVFWIADAATHGDENRRSAVLLDVLTEYWKKELSNKWSGEFQHYHAADLFDFKQNRKIKNEADQWELWLRELGHFSKNDWANIFATVKERPTSPSGSVKPETKLFITIHNLANFWSKQRTNFHFHLNDLSEMRNKLWNEIQPAESELEARVRRLVADRNQARVRKDFKESDRIRDELKAKGVVLKDNKDGTTTWEVAR